MNSPPANVKRKSLYRELTVALVALVTLVSIIVNLLGYLYLSIEEQALYENKSREYGVYLREALEWPLWNIDDELIAKIGNTFAANDEVASLVIRDDQQRAVFSRRKNGSAPSPGRETAVEHNGQKIGSVEIGLALNAYRERDRQLLLSSIATMLLLIIVLFASTRWLLSRLLRKPMDAVIAATHDMVVGKYRQIELPESYAEFTPILSGFKFMSDTVAAREASLQQINDHLSEEVGIRKRAEQALQRLNRELQAISRCNLALMRAENEPALLKEICRIICDEAGYRMAWVGHAENDDYKTVRPVAWAGVEGGYLGTANISWADTERGRGPTGIAIRTGNSTCIPDFATDPSAKPWRDNALRQGYRSCIGLPLKHQNSAIFGALTIYSTEPDAFTADEIRLLEELADDLAFGIDVLRDRAETKQTETLRAYLASIVEFSNDAIIGKSVDGVITHWNQGAEDIYGYAADEIIGEPVTVLAPPSGHAEIQALLATIRQGGVVVNREAVRRRKDGTLIHVALTLSPIKDAEGNIIGISTIARDITGKKRMEEELHRASVYNRSLIEASLDPLVTISPEGKITDVNRATEQVTGRDRTELIGTDFSDYFTEPGKAREGYLEVLRQGLVTDYPLAIRHRDGNVTEVLYNASVYRDESGSVLGIFAAARDVTERKRAEEELRRYQDHLEDEIQQRTSDLMSARNAAEAANQAKSVFLANMSHELRTPLNAILGFSTMMRKDPLMPDHVRQNLDIINRSGEHLLTLINDVLEMAKIEAGRVQLENAAFDLGGMVRDVADMMQVRAKERGLRLLVDQSSQFPRFIVGDEARLRQVLINLMGNAVKFTQQGGVTLRLGVWKNRISHLLIEVEDTGPGIAPEDQQRIFEPFVQLDAVKGSVGTGLGLSITRQFVRMMDGTLTLESTPGKGALFRVELPLREALEADISKPKSLEAGEVIGVEAGQPAYRILIVEDQLENQLLLARLMETVGMQVKVADNGEQAVQVFRSWRPHFIWMDRRMPVMDGLEATRIIRGLPGGENVKIVAVTASAFKEQRAEILAAGMDDFVSKPYRFNDIYECLAKHLAIRYTYAGISNTGQAVDVNLTPPMLSALPDGLRADLQKALEILDSSRIDEIIEEVAPIEPRLHQALAKLAENFDYPSILKALRGD